MEAVLRSLRNATFFRKLRSLLPSKLLSLAWHFPKAVLANLLYCFPSKKLTVIGVTGTKGKTSTAHMIYHILKNQGKKAVLISTIAAIFGDKQIETGLHVTNPEPFALQKLLSQALNQGYQYLVLEVTSHGLTQFRNWGIQFALGVFTQVSSDHVEYHGGVNEYRRAKAKLILKSGKVILNNADPNYQYLKSVAKSVSIPIVIYKARGKNFQTQNKLAAIAAAVELGIPKQAAEKALESFPGVPGRMELIQDKPFTVVIDFAHTPDSLKAALTEPRLMVKEKGRLVAVFGCAGERDPDRRKMGKVAAQLADFFIITAEDPRAEGVEKISEEIAQYALRAGAKEASLDEASQGKQLEATTFVRIPDRRQAINFALKNAHAGDLIGFFGKGHEKSMCFGKTEYPWSEHEVVRKALKERKKQ
jgi:UDP-N-acetylmuramoyl-L-alanyl-D-glutamate--2,6-diaminopimelate ligase